MVIVTLRAREELKRALDAAGAGPGLSLRLDVTQDGRFELFPDREQEDDEVVEHEGTPVLLLSEEVSNLLDGVTIECKDSPEGGRRLTILKS